MFSLNVQACRSHLSARLHFTNACQRSALAGEGTRVAWSAVLHGDGDGLSAVKSKVCQLPLKLRVVPEFSAQMSKVGRLIKIYILGSW
jgi:hypothetical protein